MMMTMMMVMIIIIITIIISSCSELGLILHFLVSSSPCIS